MTQPRLSPAADAFRQAQIEEWDQYVAIGRITNDSGSPIALRGYPIPASNVTDDGRVITARHVCDPQDHDERTCEYKGQPIAWSEPGMVELTESGRKRQAAKKTTRPARQDKDSGTNESTTETKEG